MQNGSVLAWWPCEEYEIRDGFLIGKELGTTRYYLPLDHTEILTAFAAIYQGDEASTLAFARRWGHIGHPAFLGTYPETHEVKEPLQWIWRHAAIVRACLLLLEYLQKDDATGLADYLISCSPNYAPSSNAAIVKPSSSSFTISLAADFSVHSIVSPGHKDWPHLAARLAIQKVVNLGIEGELTGTKAMVPTLEMVDGVGTFGIFYSFQSLLQAIYWHLGQVALDRQEKKLARCAYKPCNKFFIQTNKNQHYCQVPGYTESPCAMKARQRRVRTKRKVGSSNG